MATDAFIMIWVKSNVVEKILGHDACI